MSQPVNRSTRRRFLKQAGAAAAALPLVHGPLIKAAGAQKLRHVSFGAAGMAAGDTASLMSDPRVEIVAVCDVDERNFRGGGFKKILERFPNCKRYADWRELLDKEHKNFDSCNVSTPDHMHGPIGVSAIRAGKHVYVQKPLGQNLHDTRMLTTEARKAGVATQMGIQIHSSHNYRWAVHIVQSGLIGAVKEIHTWSNKKWGDKGPRPTEADPIPDGFHWDLWLGVADHRPYKHRYYHPGNWRKRLDFGTGTFGDMGCHIYDPVFNAVGRPTPLKVTSRGPAPDGENWAINAEVDYLFKGNKFTGGKDFHITWYDGDRRPPQAITDLVEGRQIPGQGSIVVGAEGVMMLPHVSNPTLFPQEKFKERKDEIYPKLEPWNHYHKWVDTCLGGAPASANFDYAGPLTETVILGCAATFVPNQTLEWDAENLRFTNSAEANQHVRRTYRKGWEIDGMG